MFSVSFLHIFLFFFWLLYSTELCKGCRLQLLAMIALSLDVVVVLLTDDIPQGWRSLLPAATEHISL